MKVRTKLFVSAGASIAIAIALSLVVLFAARQINQATAAEESADQVLEGMSALNALASDYVAHGGERARDQWLSVHTSLTQLASDEDLDPELSRELAALQVTFAQLVTAREAQAAGEGDAAAAEAIEARLVGQLLVHSQSATSSAVQVANTIAARKYQAFSGNPP